MNAKERLSFEHFWRKLYDGGFDIVPRMKKVKADAFLFWVESEEGGIDRLNAAEVPMESIKF
jgi:hypothetical protein